MKRGEEDGGHIPGLLPTRHSRGGGEEPQRFGKNHKKFRASLSRRERKVVQGRMLG